MQVKISAEIWTVQYLLMHCLYFKRKDPYFHQIFRELIQSFMQ